MAAGMFLLTKISHDKSRHTLPRVSRKFLKARAPSRFNSSSNKSVSKIISKWLSPVAIAFSEHSLY